MENIDLDTEMRYNLPSKLGNQLQTGSPKSIWVIPAKILIRSSYLVVRQVNAWQHLLRSINLRPYRPMPGLPRTCGLAFNPESGLTAACSLAARISLAPTASILTPCSALSLRYSGTACFAPTAAGAHSLYRRLPQHHVQAAGTANEHYPTQPDRLRQGSSGKPTGRQTAAFRPICGLRS
jgi:hypothetical protein